MPISRVVGRILHLTMLAVVSHADATWVYEDRSNHAMIEISPASSRIAIGDRGYEATFCAGPNLACIRSEVLSVAVPRDDLSRRQWIDDNWHCTVIGWRTIEHEGHKISVMRIRELGPFEGPVFLSSTKFGLVAIAETDNRDATV